MVASWVGFAAGPDVQPGTREPTTTWPIQKYLWSDFAVHPGDLVSYSVVPMLGEWNALQEKTISHRPGAIPLLHRLGQDPEDVPATSTAASSPASGRRGSFSLPDPKQNITAMGRELTRSIADPTSKIRKFLAGDLGEKLVALLTQTNAAKGHIYAALFELDDPQLVPLLKAFGKRAHILLGNGSVKKKGEDENADARSELDGTCDLHDRFSAPRALAHNKFLVLCDARKNPTAVWTGSTNWTKTGLCTQANNAILIENPSVGDAYIAQWKALVKPPATPRRNNSRPTTKRRPS